MIEIKMLKKVDLTGCTLLEGFPGAGLVGPMTLSYTVNKLELEYVGYLHGTSFPPLVSIHNDSPLPPCRFYYSKKYRIVALFAEANVMNENAVYDIADKLREFIKSNKLGQVVSISGVPVEAPNNQDVFAIASTKDLVSKLDSMGLKKIGEGVAAGIGALLLMNSALDGIDDINILIPVNPQIIDPRYAELAIKSINKVLKLSIDTSELDKEAGIVEERIKSILKRSKEAKESYDKNDNGPSMYA